MTVHDDGTMTVGQGGGSIRAHLSPVFKLLIVLVVLVTCGSAASGVGALKAWSAADEAKAAAVASQQQTSPEAVAERQAELDRITVALGVTVDCNNASRLKSMATSLEALLHLQPGSVVITPCSSSPLVPTSTTTSTTIRR